MPDAVVRDKLGAHRIQHIVRQSRLVYLAAIVRSPAEHLKHLLAFRPPGGGHQPWVELIRSDLSDLYDHFKFKLAELGDPLQHPYAWELFMRRHPHAWRSLVRLWREIPPPGSTSGRDPREPSHTRCRAGEGGPDALSHICELCPAAFSSWRGLAMHRRIAHGSRTDVRRFAGEDAVCPVCSVIFKSRLRLIAHLTEKRIRGSRPPCGTLLSHVRPLPAAEVRRLDALDTERRRDAQRQGRSQPVVGGASLKRSLAQPTQAAKRCRTSGDG